MRILLGGVAAALALGAVPASAGPEPRCTDGFEVLCTAYYVAQNATCHPKLNPC